VVVHTCHLRYLGGINRRITVQACSDVNVRPYLKNNEGRGWQSGSSSQSASVASVRPSVQTPVLPKQKQANKQKKNNENIKDWGQA
jgi:hypothetical protein